MVREIKNEETCRLACEPARANRRDEDRRDRRLDAYAQTPLSGVQFR